MAKEIYKYPPSFGFPEYDISKVNFHVHMIHIRLRISYKVQL